MFWLLLSEIFRQKHRKKKKAAYLEAKFYDSLTKRYLIELFDGDRRAVEQLMDAAQLKQPGKSQCWYAEQVLRDLKRDRR